MRRVAFDRRDARALDVRGRREIRFADFEVDHVVAERLEFARACERFERALARET